MAADHPVLYLTQKVLFTWEQKAPGGCRCLCTFYHHGEGSCVAAAEPGRLLRAVTPTNALSQGNITDALPLCAACYDAIALYALPHDTP
jgi:hypothetical protein